MKTRILFLLSVCCLSCALVLVVGCPFAQNGGINNAATEAGDATDTRPAPPASGECLVDVVVEGSGEVDVQCDDTGRFATLTATPADGFRFDGFVGSASNSNSITVSAGEGVTVTAVFTSLTDDGSLGGGSAPGDDTIADNDNDNGDDVAIGNDNDNGNENTNDNGNDNGNDNASASLLEVIVIGGLGSGFYERGTLVTVTAIVPAGKEFDKWVGDVELIESGAVDVGVIQVRVSSNINLIATFVNAPTSARPPTITVATPTAQLPPIHTVFDNDTVTITIDAEVFEGPEDRVEVFFDRDGLFDPGDITQVRDEVFFATGFSSTTTVQLDVTALEKGVSYAIGAFITDGLNETISSYASNKVRRSTLPPIHWMGSIDAAPGNSAQQLDGIVLEGVNVEDNAGSDFVGNEDFTGDGVDDFLVVARYAKPQFINPSGVGIGEAYLIAGSATRPTGRRNLNATSSPLMPGVVFRGVRAMFFDDDTDGLSTVIVAPDADGDGVGELVFGIPRVNSAGFGGWCDRRGQFLNGGVVVVTSKNTGLGAHTGGARISLDLVGQRFLQGQLWGEDFPVPEPENTPAPDGAWGQDPCRAIDGGVNLLPGGGIPDVHGWFVDMQAYAEGTARDGADPEDLGECSRCNGSVFEPETDDRAETWIDPMHGFSATLSDPYPITSGICPTPSLCPVNERDVLEGLPVDPAASVGCPIVLTVNLLDPFTPNVFCDCANMVLPNNCLNPAGDSICENGDTLGYSVGSGFYPDRIYDPTDPTLAVERALMNVPLEPLGARTVGRGQDDRFGTSVTVSAGDQPGEFFLIVSSPMRTGSVNETPALASLATLAEQCPDGSNCQFGIPGACGGACGIVPDSGVAYMFRNLNYWEPAPTGRIPPKPHQYVVHERSYAGTPNPGFMQLEGGMVPRLERREDTPFEAETPFAGLTIVGKAGEHIEILVGVPDVNGDTRADFVVGAPGPETAPSDGAVYLVYRRADLLEGDYVLEKLTLPPSDPTRLDGAYLIGDPQTKFGSSVAAELDFNHDGFGDLVIGAPGLPGALTGEVIVIFGGTDVATPGGGLPVQTLIANGQAVRISGMYPSGNFGFNVANAGDVDGDGTNDLLVSAPNASPIFDSTPFDANDQISFLNLGLDLDHNGVADDVTSREGTPNGGPADAYDQLLNAGLVYLILGANDLGNVPTGNVDIAELGKSNLKGAIFVGRRGDRDAINGDYLGGGVANNTSQGGISAKDGRFGRSRGIATIGDIDNDGKDDFILGSILADVRLDVTGNGIKNAGEAYVIYGFKP